MKISSLKYLFVYLLPITVFFSFKSDHWFTFLPVVIFFGIVPMLELITKPDATNFEKRVEIDEKNKKIYDYILYLAVPVQLFFLIYFFDIITQTPFGTITYYGRVFAMGIMCGVLGINVGHELGHRHQRWEQLLGEILLLTSFNTHFLPYHNAGHHNNVATPNDSATAKKNQWLFSFWFTSHFGSYLEAWKIENKRFTKDNKSPITLKNRMVAYSIITLFLIGTIFIFYHTSGVIAYLLASIIGIGLLETVNYIEHYGLERKKMESGRFERVTHKHSWNSDHPIGRALLFNLSRHSDHHYNGSKKYQILKSHIKSPKMPTGYPGMMLLAFLPPLWCRIMNREIRKQILIS